MYGLCLNGWSLRRIGIHYKKGRMWVHSRLRQSYGHDATNLRKNSLSRVIVKEYGDLKLAAAVANTDGLFKTYATEDNYSRTQSIGLLEAFVAYIPPKKEPRLYFQYFYHLCTTYVRLLYVAMWTRVNRNFG